MMDSIGSVLREERERRGLSVAEVYESTKITQTNLEALEADRFESFPNKVYARAFLRDYANFLNLDSAALLLRYEQEWCKVRPEPKVELSTAKSNYSWVYALLVVLVVAGGGYYVWSSYFSGSGSSLNLPLAHQASPDLPTPPVAPELPVMTKPAQNEAPAQPKAEPASEPIPTAELNPPAPKPTHITLSVTALNDVWVRVIADDKILFQQVLPAGQSREWKAKSKFQVRSGMINAVKVKLNGKQVQLRAVSKSKVPVGAAEYTLKDVPE